MNWVIIVFAGVVALVALAGPLQVLYEGVRSENALWVKLLVALLLGLALGALLGPRHAWAEGLVLKDWEGRHDWTAGDTAAQGVMVGLQVADWAQTRWFVKHPVVNVGCAVNNTTGRVEGTCGRVEYGETNAVLGGHPSVGRVNSYHVLTILGHAAVSYLLPHGVLRDAWQYVWIGFEVDSVRHNYSAGVKLAF